MTFRAVLFDVGGVIVDSPLVSFSAYEAEHGLPPGCITALIATDATSNAWARHERGEIDVAVFAGLFEDEARAAGHSVDARLLVANLIGAVRPAMVATLEAVRAHGLLVGLLTNNFPGEDGVGAMTRAELAPIVAMADAVVESSREGVRKPEPEFYMIACRRMGISPDEAVFLDDLGVNLKAARGLGMRTIKVSGDVGAALAELQDVLGIDLAAARRLASPAGSTADF